MTFSEAVKTCLIQKSFTFSGRASRSEYWWFCLFLLIVSYILQRMGTIGSILNCFIWIPQIPVASRRLHDSNLSGWFQLLPLGVMGFSFLFLFGMKPTAWGICFLAGAAIGVYLYSRKGTPEPNRFGEVPESSQTGTGTNIPPPSSPSSS